MIVEAAATAGGVWAVRRLAQLAILRGLRAPRDYTRRMRANPSTWRVERWDDPGKLVR